MKKIYLLALAGLLLCSVLYLQAHEGDHKAINAENPGEKIDLEKYLVSGKINIVDFYSQYCPPCLKISPYLVKLDKARDDIVVLQVDINRKGITRIDWGSPLAQQFKLRSIPHFKIYDESGKLTADGRESARIVFDYIRKENIR